MEGEAIPILVQLTRIADDIPERQDISVALQRLQMGREGSPSRMRAEQLKVWIRGATREKDPDTRLWGNCECENFGVPRGTHLNGTGMDNDGANY